MYLLCSDLPLKSDVSEMDEVHRIFGPSDYKTLKCFCRYMCESGKEVFTDYELFLRSGLNAYMGDEKAMKNWVLDKKENVYKVFGEDVMTWLVQRGLARRRKRKDTDGQEIMEYERTQLLEICPGFKYLLGNIDDV